MFLFIYMQLNLFLNIFGFILEYRQEFRMTVF